MTTPRDERRFRSIILNKSVLVQVFSGKIRIEGITLPDDTTVENVSYDSMMDGLRVMFCSAKFEPVPMNEIPPFLDSGSVMYCVCCENR